MDTFWLEKTGFPFVKVQDVTAGNIMEKLLPKAALFQPDNAGGSEFQLEIVPENQIPRKTEKGKNAQNDGYGNEDEGQEFDDLEGDGKTLF